MVVKEINYPGGRIRVHDDYYVGQTEEEAEEIIRQASEAAIQGMKRIERRGSG